MPKVLNRNHNGIPAGAVYIGRPSKWGNPFVIGRDGTREEVISKYQEWITGRMTCDAAYDIRELEGKDLVCFCAPRPCHGDILLKLANRR